MAWEERSGGRYYYRTCWTDGRPVKEYVGGGLAGHLAAESDRIDRERAAAQRGRERRELEHLEALTAPVLELDHAAGILARAHLIASGCHRRKGEWRRGRNS